MRFRPPKIWKHFTFYRPVCKIHIRHVTKPKLVLMHRIRLSSSFLFCKVNCEHFGPGAEYVSKNDTYDDRNRHISIDFLFLHRICYPIAYNTSIHQNVQSCATMCNHVQPCATMCNHVQPCATMCNHVQPCATMCNHVQPCATMCNHVQPCATMCNHVQPCTTMCNHVQPCATMYNHVQSCTIMYNHVQPCTTMYNHVQSCAKNLMLDIISCSKSLMLDIISCSKSLMHTKNSKAHNSFSIPHSDSCSLSRYCDTSCRFDASKIETNDWSLNELMCY